MTVNPAVLKMKALLDAAESVEGDDRSAVLDAIAAMPDEEIARLAGEGGEGEPEESEGEPGEEPEEADDADDDEPARHGADEPTFPFDDPPDPVRYARASDDALGTPEGLAGTRAYLAHVLGMSPEEADRAIGEARRELGKSGAEFSAPENSNGRENSSSGEPRGSPEEVNGQEKSLSPHARKLLACADAAEKRGDPHSAALFRRQAREAGA